MQLSSRERVSREIFCCWTFGHLVASSCYYLLSFDCLLIFILSLPLFRMSSHPGMPRNLSSTKVARAMAGEDLDDSQVNKENKVKGFKQYLFRFFRWTPVKLLGKKEDLCLKQHGKWLIK